ncbi:hypothetical protein GO755_33680 [Spirosoma sp. HMF4905]|uniref:Uncharacterized protein n=2 Tax=Spirosoma arboris TaxID=2682092 RepID=A0A7K1SN45_9BACT|nr:hypothetical protein [Spirosoma arboris]
MENMPLYVYLTFGATVLAAVWLFFIATNQSKIFLVSIGAWIVLQSVLSSIGFYSDPVSASKRFPMLFLPPLIFFVSRFFTKQGKLFIDGLDIKTLTIIHIIRIPVELVLFWLFVHKSIPEAMTFEGRNFDILSGLTAPLIYYFGFVKNKLSKSVIVAWNFACLALLINVVSAAILSLPDRFQQFGFEQPNTALGYFPFVLLPTCLVPLVIFSNLAAIRQLLIGKTIAV